MRNTYITIDHAALAHNLHTIYHQVPTHTKVLAMVKADAYGHGISHTLDGLMAADGFGVATLNEALAVDTHCQHVKQDKLIVLIEGVFSADEWQIAIKRNFSVLIHHQEQLAWALNSPPSPNSRTNTVWLKYNTGMNRLGFDQDDALKAAKALHDKGYQLILTSHFACADDKNHPNNAKQIERFDSLLNTLKTTISPNIQGSLCNSAGIFNFACAHYDWVRAGIALYGATAVTHQTSDKLSLLPVMKFSAKIMATHQLCAGESVGYGALWTATKPTRIGVVSAGYGDGYPRVVQDAWVSINKNNIDYKAPIIGRVAMDMLMIDISDLDDVGLGDVVTLWGGMPSVDEIAGCAGTISYELLCKTSYRPIRQIKS